VELIFFYRSTSFGKQRRGIALGNSERKIKGRSTSPWRIRLRLERSVMLRVEMEFLLHGLRTFDRFFNVIY